MHAHTHCTLMDNLLLLFFITSLPAVLSVQTESRVTAQRGGSVSIPCRYDQKYRDSVKYWCRGVLWGTCAVLVRTDSPQRRGDVSITDDPAQLVFTVTMGNLQVRDTNKYWCAVKIKGYGTPDDKAGVFLSVTAAPSTLPAGTPPPPPSALSTLSGLIQPSASLATPQAVLSVQTESRVTAQRGGSVSIPCRYDQKYRDSVKYWCRGVLWGTCAVLVRTDSPQRRGDVSITDDPAQLVFTVTMGNLQVRDTNKYWCAVKIKGYGTPDDKAGVFLSVISATALPPTTPPLQTSRSTPTGGCGDCRLIQTTSASALPTVQSTARWFPKAPPAVTTVPKTPPSTATPPRTPPSPLQTTPSTPSTTSPRAALSSTLPITPSPGAPSTTATPPVTPPIAIVTVSPRRPKVAVPTSHSALPATSSASGTGPKGDTTLESLGPKRYSLLWWESLMVACGGLLLATMVAVVTWKMCRERRNLYHRWEMGAMETNLSLHSDSSDSEPRSSALIFHGSSPLREDPF
ncbi:hypothetical protein AGOR_G00172300 [Albula goreensis]|uniref:Ig-like domain-containing protein n=1 Tax=Albula goreensis TaxID=1534307 RepID=A0A8T3CWX6_9TELE|nr:hypothetical protein AGOR_G00172300 [Albula goreensis]